MTDALQVMETAPTHRVELDSLVKSAAESLRIIEPWNTASSNHKALTPIIERVKEQGVAYYGALDLSIKVAVEGYTFSEDSISLCEFLLDETVSNDELEEFIADMRRIAQKAHQDAKSMSDRFRSVRQGLNQITKGIPAEVAKIQEQQQRAIELKASAERKSDQARQITVVSAAAAGIIGAGIAIGLVFPPGVMILPVLLPIFSLISGANDIRYARQAAKRETENKSCVEALQLLQRATSDLTLLVFQVDMFADWWLQMDTMLEAVETKVGQLRADRIVRLRVTSIKRSWIEVRDEYSNYKTKISKLQDYYPSSRMLESNVSSAVVGRRRSRT